MSAYEQYLEKKKVIGDVVNLLNCNLGFKTSATFVDTKPEVLAEIEGLVNDCQDGIARVVTMAAKGKLESYRVAARKELDEITKVKEERP